MKKLLVLTICISLSLGLVGCGCGSKDDATLTDDKRLAITVDGNEVFLDEAKYYAYSSQATYEVYFISEGKEIDWNAKVEGTTWQGMVKGQALDDICRRECFYAKKDEYNVKLEKEEKEEVDKKVKNYFSETSDKLKNKIGISKKRLKEVFTKDAIAQKMEDIMEAEEKGSAGKYYKDFIDDASVDCEKCWSDINFQEHIFNLKEVEEDTGLATEVPEETEVDLEVESAE
ncbi:MAG: hypothetical protein J6W35_06410 [Eubacterium sp.]|nr:hypothetical protein [Eubacterium sp.]